VKLNRTLGEERYVPRNYSTDHFGDRVARRFQRIGGGRFYGTGYYGGGGIGLILIIVLILVVLGRI